MLLNNEQLKKFALKALCKKKLNMAEGVGRSTLLLFSIKFSDLRGKIRNFHVNGNRF